jgi:transposase InsO family protein
MKQVYLNVSLGAICELFGKTRQAYYKRQKHQEKQAIKDGIVLDLVKSIREDLPRVGVRKLYFMLCEDLDKHEIKLGRDGLFELLGIHDMLVRSRRKSTNTTNSWHHFHKHKCLITSFNACGINQLWFSDITYINVGDKWHYVIFITDAYSHKVIGYNVDDNMSAKFCEIALEQALAQWEDQNNELIHHSDRGVQYCSTLYTERLKAANIKISMTQNGDPRENAVAERVNGIFKGEFLLDQHFGNLAEAREKIARMVYCYNHIRPHSSCDYLTPDQAHQMTGPLKKRWKVKQNNSIPSA